MSKYRVSVVMEAESAAYAAMSVALDPDGEYNESWESIEVEKWE